jgi:hypothetical protein
MAGVFYGRSQGRVLLLYTPAGFLSVQYFVWRTSTHLSPPPPHQSPPHLVSPPPTSLGGGSLLRDTALSVNSILTHQGWI